MNMKKSYQHRKESNGINELITQFQAHIRGYLVRKEVKKIQLRKQELCAVKIQVGFFLSAILSNIYGIK